MYDVVTWVFIFVVGLQVFREAIAREGLHSTSHQQHLPMCKACKEKTVYFDLVLGPFEYCSPQCRDEDVLPQYNTELQKFMDKHSFTSSSLLQEKAGVLYGGNAREGLRSRGVRSTEAVRP